jgi:hypothetical protein
MLTLDRLKSILEYDPSTGEFRYLVRRGTCVPGRISGNKTALGYWKISIDRKLYQAHRLAWFYVNGEWPDGYLDHINLDKTDNRIANLRIASPSENNANTRLSSRNSSGFKGVTWNAHCNKWQSSIKLGGKNHHLGIFISAELAHAAYCGAAKIAYGKFARTS